MTAMLGLLPLPPGGFADALPSGAAAAPRVPAAATRATSPRNSRQVRRRPASHWSSATRSTGSLPPLRSRRQRPPVIAPVEGTTQPASPRPANPDDRMSLRPSGPSLHHDPEPRLPAHHAVVSLRSLVQRIPLDQRPHSGERAELQRVLGIDGGPTRPARYDLPSENQRQGAHLERLRRYADDHEPSIMPEPGDRR